MKTHLLFLAALLFIQLSSNAQSARQQWTEEKAWEWHDRIGVIKGFNEPVEAYPGMPRKQIFKKAAELGFNSVRFWIRGSTADEHEKYIREIAEDASEYGLTVSPVLAFGYMFFPREDKEQAIAEAEKYVKQLVGAFANDSRIVLWDIWNEPLIHDTPELYEQMNWIEQAVHWCREMNPIQPITASIIWDDIDENKMDKAIARRMEVEALMDVHNFHYYHTTKNHMEGIERMLNRIRKVNNRPMVCTEAVARTTGATVARSLIPFAENNIHFYSWGLYICDRNWTITWGNSSYEPHEPIFHDLLHPDGEPYDWRDLNRIRDFRFAREREIVDPGIEITDRWTKDRAWRWMVTGPIKGFSMNENKGTLNNMPSSDYNSFRINCSYEEWRANPESFFKKMDDLLSNAEKKNIRVLPALLSDRNIQEKDTSLASYVAQVIRRYAIDPRIQAWEIYTYPGEIEQNTEKLASLLRLLFRYAKFEIPNQPLTATPLVRVKDFAPDFKYKEAMIHGRTAGWNMLLCEGGSTPELCNLIWSLSDIISFSSNQNAAETGWLASIAYRYGRPLVCTEWTAPNPKEAKETLDIFSKSHVFWYSTKNQLGKDDLKSFSFKPISTPIR